MLHGKKPTKYTKLSVVKKGSLLPDFSEIKKNLRDIMNHQERKHDQCIFNFI